MTNTHTNINTEVAKAIVKFQGLVANPAKKHEAKMGSFSYKFTSLGDIIEAIRKPLQECGLAYIQNVVTNETEIGIETILIHESGEAIPFSPVMMPKEKDPKKVGALLTYCRKFSLQIASGTVGEDCLDQTEQVAPKEEKKETQPEPKKTSQPKQEKKSNKVELSAWSKLAEANNEDEKRVKEMRKFIVLCKDRNVTEDADHRLVIQRATSGKKERRRDVTFQEWQMINGLIENCSGAQLHKILDDMKTKTA